MKKLHVIILVLVVVIVCQIFVLSVVEKSKIAFQKNTIAKENTLTVTLDKSTMGTTPLIPFDTLKRFYTDVFPNIARQQKNDYQNYYFVTEQSGFVSQIDKIENNGYKIFIKNNDSIFTRSYIFKKDTLPTILSGNQNIKVTINELKVGNFVIFHWKESLVNITDRQTEIIIFDKKPL